MDFESIKQKAMKLKEQASQKIDEAVDYGAKKLADSGYTISNKEEFEKIITKSKTTEFTNKETWEKKSYKHKTIIIFWEESSDFFKDALVNFPILVTKAFSQNIILRLAKSNITDVNLGEYKINSFPCLVVFEEEKVYKIIEWVNNIEKLVKSFDLDINKSIEELK